VDKQFLVCAISTNQDNVYNKAPVKGNVVPLVNQPKITVVSINQATGELVASTNAPPITQNLQDVNTYLDPSFGANVAMAFQDQQFSLLMLLASSPVNQTIQWYEMNVTT
jgi:hypothetical protein